MSMKTYNSTTNRVVNSKYIIQIDENGKQKLVLNPSWTPEQENQLKSLAPVTLEDFKKKSELVTSSKHNVYINREEALKKKIKELSQGAFKRKELWNPTEKTLKKLKENNYKKELDPIFNSKITPEEFFNTLGSIKRKKKGKSFKWRLISYMYHCVFVLKLKSLHQAQNYIAKKLKVTREWVNECIADLCEDGIFTKLYRHLCSCLYSINHLFVDMFYRDQLEELFGGVYLRWNTYQQRKFTQEVTFIYKSIIKLDSLLIMEQDLTQKGENRSKISSIVSNITNCLTKKTPVLCPFVK